MVHSQTEELKILVNKYKKTIAYQKQMTASILTRLSRLYQELKKPAKYHWYEIFMDCAPSATGILHLRLKIRIVVFFFSVFWYFMHPELVSTSR